MYVQSTLTLKWETSCGNQKTQKKSHVWGLRGYLNFDTKLIPYDKKTVQPITTTFSSSNSICTWRACLSPNKNNLQPYNHENNVSD